MTDNLNDTPAEQPAPDPAAAPAAGAAPDPAPAPDPAAREAWDEVVVAMTDLGDAVARWARAATNDPAAKQKLGQIRGGINDIAAKAETAFGQVSESDVGKQFAQGAEQAGQAIGDAAQQFTTAAAPHVKNAFAGLASAFSKAAVKVDEAARSHEVNATAPATPAPPIPDEPPTPEQ